MPSGDLNQTSLGDTGGSESAGMASSGQGSTWGTNLYLAIAKQFVLPFVLDIQSLIESESVKDIAQARCQPN